jgi:hypothetical protein
MKQVLLWGGALFAHLAWMIYSTSSEFHSMGSGKHRLPTEGIMVARPGQHSECFCNGTGETNNIMDWLAVNVAWNWSWGLSGQQLNDFNFVH